jgi:hypothetical protein
LFTPNVTGFDTVVGLLSHPDEIKLAWAHPTITKFILGWLTSVTWPQIIAVITGPICFAKQVINVVQFWKASKIVGLRRVEDDPMEGRCWLANRCPGTCSAALWCRPCGT